MNEEHIISLQFRKENYPEVVQIANELATLENRKPHDSVKILIEDEGRKKIERLKAEQSSEE